MEKSLHPKAARAMELLKMDPEEAGKQLDALPVEEQLNMLLELPAGRQRQDLLLLSSRPEVLARTMPVEDMVLTIKEIGEVDALPLIELSSNRQLTHLLDLEIWLHEGLDLSRCDEWMNLMFECGPERVGRWLKHTDFEMLVLWLERVAIKLEPEMLNDLPEALQNRVLNPDHVHHLAIKVGADLDLVKRLLDLMFQTDSDLFFALMGNLGTTPLAELEELAMRWRQGRLADRGWPELNEAMAFYATREPAEPGAEINLPRGLSDAPRYPLMRRPKGTLLAQALADPRLDGSQASDSLAFQLANLINRVLVADGLPAGETESMRTAGDRVAGRIEIGLAQLGASDLDSALRLLQQIPLLHLAQIAQAALVKRRKRIQSLQSSAGGDWLLQMASPLPERIAYAVRHRPLFLEPDHEWPRDFSGPADLIGLDEDLDKAQAALSLTEALALRHQDLPQPFPPGSRPESPEALDLESILLTCFLQEHAGLQANLSPLPAKLLPQAIAQLPSEAQALSRRFVQWSITRSKDLQDAKGLPPLAETLARRLLEQLKGHSADNVDYRFIEGLWVDIEG